MYCIRYLEADVLPDPLSPIIFTMSSDGVYVCMSVRHSAYIYQLNKKLNTGTCICLPLLSPSPQGREQLCTNKICIFVLYNYKYTHSPTLFDVCTCAGHVHVYVL